MSMPEPREINRLLARLGGRNIHGEAMFRVVWGGNATENLYSLRIGSYTQRLKYPNRKSRWVMERWSPPPMDRDSWERMQRDWMEGQSVDVLGPFPSRGTYEYVTHFATPHVEPCDFEVQRRGGDGECVCGGCQFVPLTVAACQAVLDAVKISAQASLADRRHYFEDREKKREADWDSMADAILDDSKPNFGYSWASMHGALPNYNTGGR